MTAMTASAGSDGSSGEVSTATPTRRTRLSPDERREQLLDLGLELLADRTLEELSIDLLAEKAGISRGLLFHYFKNKNEFHREVVKRAATELLERTAPNPADPAIVQITSGLGAYVDYVIENYATYTSLVRGAGAGNADMREIADSTRAAMADRLVDSAGRMGIPVTDRAHLIARGCLAFVEEVVIAWVPDQKLEREELIASLGRSMLAIISEFAPPDVNLPPAL
jgi:AcrR family transcriptional regulator